MAFADVFLDDWNANDLASYTFDEGASTGMGVSTGYLERFSGTPSGSGIRADLTGGATQRGTLMFQFLAASNASSNGVVCKRISANNFLMGQATGTAAGPNIQLYTRVAGAYSNKTNVAIAAKSMNTDYWWRMSLSGNVMTGEFFTSDPYAGATAAHTTTFTLTGTDATSFGTGVSGSGGFRFSTSVAGDAKQGFIRFEQDVSVLASFTPAQSPTFKALIGR